MVRTVSAHYLTRSRPWAKPESIAGLRYVPNDQRWRLVKVHDTSERGSQHFCNLITRLRADGVPWLLFQTLERNVIISNEKTIGEIAAEIPGVARVFEKIRN